MNAEELAIDPVAAAHRLLGATIAGRGVRAMVVEVEAYGGVPDGPWPDAAAHSYRGRNGRNDVMFGPRGGFTPTAAMGSMSVPTSRAGPMARLPLCYLGPPPSRTAPSSPRLGAGRRCALSHWRAARETSALPSESPWPTTGLTCLIRPVRCG
ncbi:3-methyladenine DNA glycosylase [Mycobacterium tuberculosis variant bovis BCG]|nr:3-methyladenine DNA glycosylase [Mycobacterium tuberculosis variant bovis BCG]